MHTLSEIGTVLLWVMLVGGLAMTCYFLVVHRPTSWFRWEAINASGWVIAVAMYYVRSIALLALHGGQPHWQGATDAVTSLLLLGVVDLVIVARVVSFLTYRRQYREEHPLASARAHNDRVPPPHV